MGDTEWPPPLRAFIRNASGDEYQVTGHHEHRDLGLLIVVKRPVPGGWKARPVTRDDWMSGSFLVVPGRP